MKVRVQQLKLSFSLAISLLIFINSSII